MPLFYRQATFFTGIGTGAFCFLIAFSTLVDYVAALKISSSTQPQHKKQWLFVSIGVNLGVLGFFKYFNFFAASTVELLNAFGLQASSTTLNIVLPVGISFYTFQTLSYTIDVYLNRIKPTRNLLQFASFVSFFPQLVAGPIERAADLLPQFNVPHTFSYKNAMRGIALIAYGFFKKIAIADAVSPLINPVFNNLEMYQNWEIGAAIFGFSLQIYADFSGYSDIAIGLALLLGFKLSTNFSTPYFAKNIQEFWQRWHITLSSWFKDYVYVPLGGSKRGKARWVFAVLVTFGLSGLWHGAAYGFIVWGLWHGTFYLLQRFIPFKAPRAFSVPVTFCIVLVGWIFFRLPVLADAKLFFHQLFLVNDFNWPKITQATGIVLGSILVFFVLEKAISSHKNFAEWLFAKRPLHRAAILYVVVFWTLLFGAFQTGQHFIYFQF